MHRPRKCKPWVVAGYALAGVGRPLMAAASITREIGLDGIVHDLVVLDSEDGAGAAIQAHAGLRFVAGATPPQKLALVQALRAEGEPVAVTGDGINDVPALRQADVRVAVGE